MRAGVAAAGVLLVLASLALPLWRAVLVAPQYPDNLHLIAYGSQVTGDVEEIDLLNHYVGMRAFDPADVPEMTLWPFAVAVGVVAAAAAAVFRRRLVRRLALAYLWALPFGVLAVIQLRLHQYGHDIDPSAALRIPEFTPWVVGPTNVMNFTTWSYPGSGWLVLLGAAVVVTFGPRLVAGSSRAGGRPAAALVAAVLALGVAAGPAVATTADPGSPDLPAGHGHAPGPAEPAGQRAGPQARPAPPAAASDEPARDLAALLAAVEPGDTVSLAPGRWQGPATIDVPIELHGLGRAVIDGDGTGSVLVVRAPGTTVTGVHVRGSGPGPTGDPAGIRVEADDVRVESVVVEDSYVGIAVSGAQRTHLVRNTVHGRADAAVAGEGHALEHEEHADADDHQHAGHGRGRGGARGDGVSLWHADGVLVRDNHVHGARDGIYVSFGSSALLDRNHVTRSRYAVHTMFARDLTLAENRFEDNLSAAVLMYGGPALLLRNEVTDNRSAATGFGILLKDIDAVEAVENIVARNRVGVHLEVGAGGADPARLHRNTVASNDVGVALHTSTRARLSANSFVANTVQVAPKGGGTPQAEWTEKGWGNYWDTYRGYEGGLPGMGAMPHGEGGRIDTVLQRAPVLAVIADSPGLRVLRGLEARWTTRTPAIVDELPLTRPLSPPVPPDPVDPVGSPLVALVSVLLLLGGGAAVVCLRRRPEEELA